MEIFIFVVKGWQEVFDYILIFGFFGLGKIMLVNIIVNEMGGSLKSMFGLVLECVGDLVVMFINFEYGDVLFVDEIYCLSLVVEEIFYLAMEDYQLDIMIGEGFVVCFIKIDLLLFILVGVIIWVGLFMLLLRDCFGIVQCFEFYLVDEFVKIVNCFVGIFGLVMEYQGVVEIVRCSCGMLRIVNRLLCRVWDYVEVKSDGWIMADVVVCVLDMLKVDCYGFDMMDCRLFLIIMEKFDGGLVGVENLVVVISEEVGIFEDVVEFYLIQQGFIMCIFCGCVVICQVYLYFGFKLSVLMNVNSGDLFQDE